MSGRPRWPLVEVEWRDAHTHSGWTVPAAYRAVRPAACWSVGYLLHRDRHRLVLVQSHSPTTGDVADGLAIPARAVRRVRRLR